LTIGLAYKTHGFTFGVANNFIPKGVFMIMHCENNM